MALTSSIKLNIAKKLEDKDYRSRFFRGQAQDLIAMSIRKLRKKRKKIQAELANECDMKQSAVSRIEQADYSGWSFSTLLRIADALDARLRITFDLAEDVIDQYREEEAIDTIGTEDANKFTKMYPLNVFDKAANIKDRFPAKSGVEAFKMEHTVPIGKTEDMVYM